jgi:uncharacterized protein (TIGR00255 family)
MLRSMTGFGRSVMEDADWTQTWEIRSVNNRRLDVKWRLPPLVHGLEAGLERIVRRHASRGRMEVSLFVQSRGGARPVRFDKIQALAMVQSLRDLSRDADLPFAPDLNALLGVSALWTVADADAPVADAGEGDADDAGADLPARLEEGLETALADWNDAREAEGRSLARDLTARILRLEEWVDRVEDRAPDIRTERFDALRDRVAEIMAGLHADLDESRLLQELVILTDKLDVSEELIRLRAHLERLRDLLDAGSDAGRRLDFTLQECFREINTCGNKIQDAQLSRLIVDFKNELEKFREQVQNLE